MKFPDQTALPKVDGQWGLDNLYCRYTFTRFSNNEDIYLLIDRDKKATAFDTFYIEVLDLQGKISFKNVSDDEEISYQFENLRTMTIHYVGYAKVQDNSFTIITSDKEIKVNIVTVFIILGIVIITVMVLVIILYRCRQAYLLKQAQDLEDQERELRRQEGTINGYNAEYVDERDGRVVRHVIKPPNEIIETNRTLLMTLFQTKLRPQNYIYSKNEFNANCTICLEDFSLESLVIVCFCHHIFHADCLNTSLMKNLINPRCPNCNNSIFDESVPQYAEPNNQNINITPAFSNQQPRFEQLPPNVTNAAIIVKREVKKDSKIKPPIVSMQPSNNNNGFEAINPRLEGVNVNQGENIQLNLNRIELSMKEKEDTNINRESKKEQVVISLSCAKQEKDKQDAEIDISSGIEVKNEKKD